MKKKKDPIDEQLDGLFEKYGAVFDSIRADGSPANLKRQKAIRKEIDKEFAALRKKIRELK